MSYQLQIRRDTAANWSSVNPVLAEGEFGIETDTTKIKIGNGADPWTDINYWTGTVSAVNSVNGQTGNVVLDATDIGTIVTDFDGNLSSADDTVQKALDTLDDMVAGVGSGDVVGPASATDGNLAVFDGATGKLIKDGGAVPSGAGTPSSTVADLDGTGAAGSSTDYSRGDHKHGDSDRHAHANLTDLGNVSGTNTGDQDAGDIAVTTQNVGNSTNLDTFVTNLDDSITSQKETGFGAWTSGADASTYTITGGKFQLDRDGYGYINGKKITWSGGQQTGSLSANTFYSVYIDASGNIQTATVAFTPNVIRLFEVLYDGTIYQVAKENHPKEFQSAVSGWAHKVVGTVIEGTGAIITRVATGTGASADDRRVKIVGADVLSDHGLESTISAQNPVTWNVFYRNGAGAWIRDSQASILPIKYNNAGTPTALDATPNIYGVYVLYVMKDDIESSSPQYVSVMGESSYATLSDALSAIASGAVQYSTNELKNMESAQLGYAIVQYSATGGYIEELQVAKSTLNQQFVGGGGGAGNDHALLNHLDYASAGHTGFAPALGADDNYVTDAEKTVIGNTSGANSGDSATPAETRTTIGALINGATTKATPIDNDLVGYADTEASNIIKKLTWTNIKAFLKTYFDSLYQPSGSYLTDVVNDTTPQLGGDLEILEHGLKLDDSISADGHYSGWTENGTAGTTLAFGDLVYQAVADNRWELTDANLSATYDKKLGICLTAGNDGDGITILLWGKVNAANAFPTLTPFAPVYMSETAGDITNTAPTTADAAVRVIGYGNTGDELYFHPKGDVVIYT